MNRSICRVKLLLQFKEYLHQALNNQGTPDTIKSYQTTRRCIAVVITVFIILGGSIGGILYAAGVFSDYHCPSTFIDNGTYGGLIEYPIGNGIFPDNTRCEWKLKSNRSRQRIGVLISYMSIDCDFGNYIQLITSDGTTYGSYCKDGLTYPLVLYFETTSVTVRFQSKTNYEKGKGFRISYFYDDIVNNASTPQQCGVSPTTKRIVDGDAAIPGQWPWQVSVNIVSNQGIELCGGSVINDRWILTAAHCLTSTTSNSNFQIKQITVRVGAYNLWQRMPGEHWIPVVYHVKNAGYDNTARDNDVALLQLSESAGVAPICLPAFGEIPPSPGTYTTAIGWGLTMNNLIDPAAALREVFEPIVDTLTCSGYFSISITNNMICAGFAFSRGTCIGDSGGPLMIQKGNQCYTIGITSWGSSACNEPSVYTKVANYINWIQANMNH